MHFTIPFINIKEVTLFIAFNLITNVHTRYNLRNFPSTITTYATLFCFCNLGGP